MCIIWLLVSIADRVSVKGSSPDSSVSISPLGFQGGQVKVIISPLFQEVTPPRVLALKIY